MPDNLNSTAIDNLKKLDISDTYKKVKWTDGAEPPLDAAHLNRFEDALSLIFASDTGNGSSIISRLVKCINDIVEACKAHESENIGEFNNFTTELNNLRVSLENSKLSNSPQYEKIKTVAQLLEEVSKKLSESLTTHNTTKDSHEDIRNILADIQSNITDNVVNIQDELILYCGSSTKNLFTKS